MGKEYVGARTGLEETLVEIWQQVLRVTRVGVHDNFFEIGGHSLLVVQLNARINQALDIELPLIELYKHPTVAALAAQITRMTSGQLGVREVESSASPLVLLSARESGDPIVLIPGIAGVLPGYYDLAQAIGEV